MCECMCMCDKDSRLNTSIRCAIINFSLRWHRIKLAVSTNTLHACTRGKAIGSVSGCIKHVVVSYLRYTSTNTAQIYN